MNLRVVASAAAVVAAVLAAAAAAHAAAANGAVLEEPPRAPHASHSHAKSLVFSKHELRGCVRLRGPSVALNPVSGAVHVAARCCGKNMCSQHPSSTGPSGLGANLNGNLNGTATGRRLDDDAYAYVVMKTSLDNGTTWGRWQRLSPKGQTGYGCVGLVFDRVRGRLVAMYESFRASGGVTSPAVNATYLQMYSSDDGASWSPTADKTAQLAPCQPSTSNMLQISAGDKAQSADGRILWIGHANHKDVCVWYSDDGGDTYQTSERFKGNEISLTPGFAPGEVLGNGRGLIVEPKGHRAMYRSTDNGATWSDPVVNTQLPGVGCEASMVNANGLLLFLGPTASGRSRMTLFCSRDQGSTWPSSLEIDGDNHGGYSIITPLAGGNALLLVWEDGQRPDKAPLDPNAGNFYSKVVEVGDWCK